MRKESHEVVDDYIGEGMKNNQLYQINKEWLFFKAGETCSILLEVYDYDSGDTKTPSVSCSETESSMLNFTFGDRMYTL